MEPAVVGIDLGTTYSAVAYVDEGGRPRALPNGDGKLTTPSAVLVQDGRIAVGDVALNQWVTNDEHVIRWVKRSMGDDAFRFQGLSAVEISAEILKALKADAERELGQPVEEAVITCPAYFAAREVENTKRAGELAGLRVREVVKEPTAAAVYYGVEHMRDGQKVLVCDLGGGTFDATVLAYEQGVFRPLASTGDRELGGHEWTTGLAALVIDKFRAKTGEDPQTDPVAYQFLYEECEKAKRNFARVASAQIPCACHGRRELVPVSRDEFEQAMEWRIQQLVMWAEHALARVTPALAWKDIDHVLLVGGSSRLRRMALALEEASGKKPLLSPEPDLCVALGAAVLARGRVRPRRPLTGLEEVSEDGLIEVQFTRAVPRSLGTRVLSFEADAPRIVNSLILPHNTEIPAAGKRDYEASADGQAFFDVPVVEFEDEDDYDLVGNYRFRCPPDVRRGDLIEVTFRYDESGIVTAEALHRRKALLLPGERLPYEEPDVREAVRFRVKPRWVVFAVDVSGSMTGAKMAAAKAALLDNARGLLALGGDGCKVGVVSFAAGAAVVCRPTADLAALERATHGMHPGGTTAMDEGIRLAVELVLAAPAGAGRDVVMLTDGMPDDVRRDSTLEAARLAGEHGVTLSTVGVGSENVDLDFLKRLTPLSLVIERADDLGASAATLLTEAARLRGLEEAATGGTNA